MILHALISSRELRSKIRRSVARITFKVIEHRHVLLAQFYLRVGYNFENYDFVYFDFALFLRRR